MKRLTSTILAALLSVSLSGCATTSFAPPQVTISHPITRVAPGTCSASAQPFVGKTKRIETVTEEADDPFKQGKTTTTRKRTTTLAQGPVELQLDKNFEGAMALVDNFMLAYRCAAHEAADGRQLFQIPSFFLAAAAVTGSAFGLNKDQLLGLGVGSAVFKAGNDYLAPKQKAAILDSAIDALTCIKAEGTGMTFFDTRNTDGSAFRMQMTDAASGTFEIPVERQYFEMMSAALFSVERVLARRLSGAGTEDMGTTIDKLKELLPKAKPNPTERNLIDRALAGDGRAVNQAVTIDLANVRARVQICILRANGD